jgi:predicted DNA-binding transcriptional regulator AlpA
MSIPRTQRSPYPVLEDRVVNLVEAARITGVSTDTLRRCHKRQELTILKLSPRRVGIRLSHLMAWLDSRAA